MPLNTAQRRFSAIGMYSRIGKTVPLPDGLIDTTSDRLQLLGLYSGITPSLPVADPRPSAVAAYGGSTVGQSTTLTFSVTVTDAAQKLVVMAWNYDFTVTMTGVTFHGDPLSPADRYGTEYLWALGAPDVGTYNLVVTLDVARWMGAVCWVVEDWDGQFRDLPGSVSTNGKMRSVISFATHQTLTFASGINDLTLHWIHSQFENPGLTFAEDFGQAVGFNGTPGVTSMPGETTSKAGDTSVTVGFTTTPSYYVFVGAVSLLAPDPPPEPEAPYVGINPQQGDPLGEIHFIRVKIGVNVMFAGEALIRDAAEPWGGKKLAELLSFSETERALSREGYEATTREFEVSDVPDAETGNRRWRNLFPTTNVESALVEHYRCQAPHGMIIGTPFRLWAGVVKPGGFTATGSASAGFRFKFSCADIHGDRFGNPLNQPPIPTFRLNTTDIVNLVPESDGKYLGRVLGNCTESGVGAIPAIPIVEDVNLFDLLGGLALNVNVDGSGLSEGMVYDIPKGYYNPIVWGKEAEVREGDLIRPTPENRNGHVFRAGNDGTTGTTEPTWPTSGTVVDNDITWHEAGADDPKARYPIPDEAYTTWLTHPYAPNWTAITGRSEQYIDWPFPSGTRRITPVFFLHDHRFSAAVREGRMTPLFDVIGARQLASSGPPLLKFTAIYIRLLLDYLSAPTDLTTYGDIPIFSALDGPYSVIDLQSADDAEAVGDALGGMTAGFEIAANGQQEQMWDRLGRVQRGGALELGPNRHGQIMFARRDVTAQPTITFKVTRIIESSYHTDGRRRATKMEFRFGPRYRDPFASVATPSAGDPLPSVTNKNDWGWQSGLQKIPAAGEPNPAYDTLRDTNAAYLPPLKFDNDATRDFETAIAVARLEYDYATGPAPAYHGTTLWELNGPIEELLFRLDSNGKTRELNDVVGLQDDQGPTGDGEATIHRCRVTRIRENSKQNLCTLIGEFLPPEDS